jgi:hypothetical protein
LNREISVKRPLFPHDVRKNNTKQNAARSRGSGAVAQHFSRSRRNLTHQQGSHLFEIRGRPMTEVTVLIEAIQAGEPHAAEQLLPLTQMALTRKNAKTGRFSTYEPSESKAPTAWLVRPALTVKLFRLLSVLTLILLTAHSVAASPNARHVLFIYGDQKDLPMNLIVDSRLRSIFREKLGDGVELYRARQASSPTEGFYLSLALPACIPRYSHLPRAYAPGPFVTTTLQKGDHHEEQVEVSDIALAATHAGCWVACLQLDPRPESRRPS